MPSPLGYSFVSSAKLTGNAQIDSLIYGTYWMGTWSNGAFTTPLTYSFMTTDSLFARFYSDDNEYEAGYVLSSAQQSSIVDALGAWSSVANIKFTQVTETSTNVGDLRFGGYGDMDTGTAAWAYYPSRTPSGGDVWIGPVTNNPAPVEGTYDYLTFMHEIGHALGLKHPFDQGLSNPTVLASQYDDVRYTIMSYDNAYSYEPTTPMLLDIAAIQRLYGANTQWQTGNNTYSWASDQSVFETIWDAGGTDTIDASNQVAAVRINLNEGQFSKIGKTFLDPSDKVFNEGLAIAYGAKIENAVGSAFNDSLIGNALGNVLNGLAGKDSMAGGAGNDTYVVDDAGDIVSETSTLATEIDTVRSSVTWALGANLENLTLSGNSSINGTGNALNNTLIGNDGNNVLNGSAGRDTLIGGAGNDTYVLDQAAELTLLRESVSQGTDSLVIAYAASSASSVVDLNLSNLGSIENVTLSGAGAFSVSGNSLNNSLVGNAAANVLNGQGGADTLDGGAGNDTYYVDNVGDTVIERGASILEVDSVISSISYTLGANLEALTLSGTAGISGTGNGLNNRITGNAGANTLDGGIGIDTLAGGTGNDTYVVDNLKDVVSETSTLASEIDTVRSSVTWTLGANLENLTLTGTAAINGTGNALGNVLTGNAGNNLLNGGAGRDTLIGGAGNDTYVLDQAGELALLQEAADQGTDSLAIGYASSSPGTLVDLTLSNLRNIENVTLSGAGVFTVVGNDQDNRLIGNAAVNTLRGGAGNDYLDGGAGADTLTGGTDDDTYTVDNLGDKVVEAAGEGRDLIRAAVSYTLSTNVEDGQLLGTAALNLVGNALDNSLIGNAAANVLNGQGGADTLDGGAGNDTYYVDNVGDTVIERGASILEVDSVISSISYTLGANLEALTLSGTAGISGTGNGLNNRITGNAGANTLDGGIGIDTLAGGTGNDTYVVDNLKDVVSETSTLASEIDTVRSSVTWTLGANLENLTLTGTAAINGTGNALGNVLTGNAGNNLLNGGAGRDTLIGGAGNDTYVLDQAGELALLQEAADQGTDSLAIGYASSSPGTVVDLTLSNLRNIENVTLSGAGVFTVVGNDQDNRLIGNAAVNTLRGGAGNDYLDGGAGADTLTGGTDDDTYTVDNVGDKVVEAAGEGRDLIRAAVSYTLSTNVEDGQLLGTAALNLVGNALDNSLVGNAAANVLNGQGGADTLDGGAGNDTYYVDNVGDTVIERGASILEVDSVISSISYTLGANLEALTLSGTAGISGTGNGLNNRITGNAGANTLDGGIGIDTLAGGTGNDTYVVDNLKDVVSETSTLASEIDTVRSSVTWTLGANLENLTLTGTAAINGTGNALGNVLTGNVGNNVLNGGAGNDQLDGGAGADMLVGGLGTDTLTGGEGADRFVFSALNELGKGGIRDVILDFNSLQGDKLDLSKLDANILTTAINPFSFIDSNVFTGAGQLRFVDNVLYGNINGSLDADFEIQLVGVNTFSANDLVA